MSGWLLDELEIEGFRGINNDGDPLRLRFSKTAINSIFAPNGVGKSSIFDAVAFAIRGYIPKLDGPDGLPAAERAGEYYVNRFHSKAIGTVRLTLSPEVGGAPVRVTATRTMNGQRAVSGPPGIDAEALLASLDRDFVLLDYRTFQSFMGGKDIDRGRAFSGLLGLSRYSSVRQELQTLANTRAFNSHFDTSGLSQKAVSAQNAIETHASAAKESFFQLTQDSLTEYATPEAALERALAAMTQILIIAPHCDGKTFQEIVIDDCLAAVSATEVGEDRKELTALIQAQTRCETLIATGPKPSDVAELKRLSTTRDKALAETSGALLQRLFMISHEVLSQEYWENKFLCPTCDEVSDHSVLDHVCKKLAYYEAVEIATKAIKAEWSAKQWTAFLDLERAEVVDGEAAPAAEISKGLDTASISEAQVNRLDTWRTLLLSRAEKRLDRIKAERVALEQKLPPSLVAVTTSVEAARRLQSSLRELAKARSEMASIGRKQVAVSRVKTFLDAASGCFATAETNAATRRLAAIQPVCQEFFAAIMHEPVVPKLVKSTRGEDLSLLLGRFWTLTDVSAQALLSESYRNAFAVSVYLAAASLYAGDARFMLLDDITSSFDAGHQFHLMEIIRTRFARPGKGGGPQVVLFSHDTLLEKLFNKNANQGDWSHQRLEGTARTAVLPQSNAVNRVKDATIRFLNAGQIDDGSHRLRQYLEFKLLEIISRVQIPVPMAFALDDHKKQPQACVDAIENALQLHLAAKILVLEPAQTGNLQINVAMITGNFLAHYATGSAQSFSAASLLGVVAAIDAYADCFTFEHPPGSGNRQYYKSLSSRF